MKPTEVITTAQEAMTVKRVIGEPHEKNGVTVIPAAVVRGGGGGGGGEDKDGQEGGGGGFGLNARPAGAFVIRGERVRWQPAVDPNRIIVVLGAVAVAYFLSRARRCS
ncbi:MAG TPA: spore germination protein GerW family protein [Segeticoccus sp.]|uniref:spore germination protein GerW family protein n=1 Tax=Segeticoccus sp. TaxID=2706531 RepID=UPI002D7F21F2|nr:spore germination protein GerW family protein [Segeticoccus sp.]HET8601137.1 spore germination protein GerW family protein [Segeticoccus sp.]